MQVVTKYSSPPKGHSLPSPPSSANSEHPEIAIEGQQVHSKLEHTASLGRVSSKSGDIPTVAQGKTAIQFGSTNLLSSLSHRTARDAATDDGHGPSDSCDARSVSSGRLSTTGYRKRLSQIFKGDSKVKETIPASAALSAPITLFGTEGRIQSAAPDHSTVPVSLKLHSPADPVETSSTMLAAPDNQVRLSPTAEGPIRMDIFPGNAAKPTYKTDLPKPHARVDKTPQLVYCCSLLSKAQGSHSSTSASDASQNSPLDDEEKTWVQLIDPVLQDRYQWLVEQLVKAFEQTTVLDVTLLEGLVQLVECASSGYLVDDDLVRIATALSRELSNTHIGFSNHPLCLTLSLARVLDVMVTGEVKDLNRERDHQPMLQLLDILKDSGNVVQKYEASYAHQALQYAPDNETPLQVLWRYAKVAAAGAGAVASVFKLDPEGLLKAIESLHWIGAGVVGSVTTRIEAVGTLRFGADGVVCASEREFDLMTKRSWYLALQGTALFIRQGRLSDFNLVVSQAPCRHNPNFQWGICRQLGEIAVDPLWDAPVRRQAVEFLGELFRNSTDWKPHVDVKRWILTIFVQIKDLSDVSIKNRAGALLLDLKKGDIA
ncbi:hypothetical protein BGZ89_004178, partial [Linnemannia elongata]